MSTMVLFIILIYYSLNVNGIFRPNVELVNLRPLKFADSRLYPTIDDVLHREEP